MEVCVKEQECGIVLSSLTNLGNTCYKNSIHQLLFHTPIFREFFLYNDYVIDLREKTDDDPDDFKDTFVYEFHRLIKVMWTQSKEIKPLSIKNYINVNNRTFRGNDQHDSQEFLIWIFEKIHSETKRTNHIGKLPWEINVEHMDQSKMLINLLAISNWKEYNKNETSIITYLFTGLNKIDMVCDNCGYVSTKFETFTTLDLDIPDQDSKIETVFDKMIKPEQLDDDCKTICNYCCKSNKSKRLTSIFYSPKILMIHFKRFQTDAAGTTSIKKTNLITYPLNDFELGKYMSVYSDQKPKYQLYGVNIHSGSMTVGHYYSLIKNQQDNNWYKYNDNNVTKIDKIQNSDAYLLFYYRNN
jgi:ubiquitin C-terminal hydrolase